MLILLRPVLLRSVIAVLMFLRNEIRNRLKNSGVGDVQSALNQVLKDKIIETLPRRALTFAIGFVFIPFYGKEESEGDTIKINARQGTPWFFVYSPTYVIRTNATL